MDIELLQRRLGMKANLQKVSSKAKELVRLCNLRFAGGLGLGEVCKSMVCLELACIDLKESFDQAKGIRFSGADEKVYSETLLKVQNILGIRLKLDARELCLRFGCIRMVDAVQRALADYRTRFVAGLPEVRKQSADFSRPVFRAAAFFLAAKKRKLKVDKAKIIQACGTSEAEFANVTTSMYDLCFDTLGVEKRKRAAQEIKSNRDLLDALPEKRARPATASDDEADVNAEDDISMLPLTSKARAVEERLRGYEEWKQKALAPKTAATPNNRSNNKTPATKTVLKQAKISFARPANVQAA